MHIDNRGAQERRFPRLPFGWRKPAPSPKPGDGLSAVELRHLVAAMID